MAGFENWFTFKSAAQRKKEREEYDLRLFPYGEKQRQTIVSILKQLLDHFDGELSLYQYLVCKDILITADEKTISREKIDELTSALRFTMKKKNRDDLFSYIALCEADLKIGEDLNYPDIRTLKERAQELKKIC